MKLEICGKKYLKLLLSKKSQNVLRMYSMLQMYNRLQTDNKHVWCAYACEGASPQSAVFPEWCSLRAKDQLQTLFILSSLARADEIQFV